MTNTTAAPKERPAETNSVDTLIPEAPSVYPYPRWWSSVERGFLFVLATTVFGIVIYLFASPTDDIVPVGDDVPMGMLVTGILGGSLGFLTDGLSIILLIRDKYGPKGYWIWNCLWDIITAACCAGCFAVGIENKMERDQRIPVPPTNQATRILDALMWLGLITAVGHFAANVAGFYGIHLVNKRGRVPGAAEHDDLDV